MASIQMQLRLRSKRIVRTTVQARGLGRRGLKPLGSPSASMRSGEECKEIWHGRSVHATVSNGAWSTDMK